MHLLTYAPFYSPSFSVGPPPACCHNVLPGMRRFSLTGHYQTDCPTLMKLPSLHSARPHTTATLERTPSSANVTPETFHFDITVTDYIIMLPVDGSHPAGGEEQSLLSSFQIMVSDIHSWNTSHITEQDRLLLFFLASFFLKPQKTRLLIWTLCWLWSTLNKDFSELKKKYQHHHNPGWWDWKKNLCILTYCVILLQLTWFISVNQDSLEKSALTRSCK